MKRAKGFVGGQVHEPQGLTPLEERRLLAAARRGDARAGRRLAEALAGPVYRFGRNFCRDADDARDVMQETLASLFRGLEKFQGRSSLTSWAYVVARNACTRHRRRRAGEPRVFETLDSTSGTGAVELPDPDAGPEIAAERSELRAAVREAIAALPASQRDVLVLRDIEGQPARTVAGALGLDVAAVKSRLHRARAALRRALESHAPASVAARRKGCPDIARMLSRELEGELDASTCARIEAHVRSCPSCAEECEMLRLALTECRRQGVAKAPRPFVSAVNRVLRERLAAARRTPPPTEGHAGSSRRSKRPSPSRQLRR